mgnify:CR=1 FL=1
MRAQHSYNARKSHSHRITVQYANTQHSHCAADTRKRQSRADSRKARRLLDVSARVRMCVLLRTHNRSVPIGDCGWSNTLRQAHCCTANSGTLAFGVDLTARGARATTWVSRTERVRVTRVAVRVQAGRRDRFATSQQLCIDLQEDGVGNLVPLLQGQLLGLPGPTGLRSVRARHDASGHASQASPC